MAFAVESLEKSNIQAMQPNLGTRQKQNNCILIK
jgi:hypothetical protein